MLYVFGDSWGYGSELSENEKPFIRFLSSWLDTHYKNFSKPGMSLGHIVDSVIREQANITSDDYVVVVVPPDTRWYEVNDNFKLKTLSLYDNENKELLKYYNLSWFIYHHNLFIYTIMTTLANRTNKFVLAHNYGKLVIIDSFKELINKDRFLSQQSLTSLLSDNDWDDNYSLDCDGPPLDVFRGKYFEGKHHHPNQLGHIEIAKHLLKKFQTYKI